MPTSRDDDPESFDVFISYTATDRNWAEWIASVLEEKGYTTRYQHRDFGIGQDFVHEMQRALLNASAVLAVVSERYLDSRWCMAEWTAAYDDEKQVLVPVKVEPCKPGGLLSHRIWIDVVDRQAGEAQLKIIDGLSKIRASGLPTPSGDPFYPGDLTRLPISPIPVEGRDFELSTVAERLVESDQAAIIPDQDNRVGRGCSALAAEYVRTHAADYSYIAWIHASDVGHLPLEFRRLGRILNLPLGRRTRDQVLAELERRSSTERPALIVYDDAAPRGRLLDWFPTTKNVKTLVASTSDAYRSEDAVSLGPIRPEDASQIVTSACANHDAAAGEKLALLLDNDPAAVSTAAHLMKATRVTASSLLESLSAETGRPDELMLTKALQWLDAVYPSAIDLLVAMSGSVQRPIPQWLFAAGRQSAGGQLLIAFGDWAVGDIELDVAVGAIEQLGLGYLTGDHLVVSDHKAAAARAYRTAGQVQAIRRRLMELVHRALEDRIGQDDEDADVLEIHARALFHGPRDGIDQTLIDDLRLASAEHRVSALQLEDAKAVVDEILESSTRPETITRALLVAADIARKSGSPQAAAASLADAADPELDQTQRSELNTLRGEILVSMGRADEACKVLTEAVEGTDSKRHVLEGKSWLALATLDSGDHQTAMELANDVVEAASDWQGPDGPLAAHGLLRRGQAGRALDRPTAAEDLRTALVNLTNARSRLATDAAIELGRALAASGDVTSARYLYGRAAVMLDDRFGPFHEALETVIEELAASWRGEDDEDRAAAILARLVESADAAFPRLHKTDQELTVSRGDPLSVVEDAIKSNSMATILGPKMNENLMVPLTDITQQWAETYKCPIAQTEWGNVQQIAQYMEIVEDRAWLARELTTHISRRLKERFGDALSPTAQASPDNSPDTIHLILREAGRLLRWIDPFERHRVVARLPSRVFVTTSIASVLIDALEDAGKQPRRLICNWRDEESPGHGEVPGSYEPSVEEPLVIHLFGHLAEPESVMLTQRDYVDFVVHLNSDTGTGIHHSAATDLATESLLILGFDFADWEFHTLLRSLIQKPRTGRRSNRSLAVQIRPNTGWRAEEKATTYMDKYFEDTSNVHLLWNDLSETAKAIAQVIR